LKFVLLLTISLNAFGSDVTTNNPGVDILLMDPYPSTKYLRGQYLLYDCIDKHWVCTSKAEFGACKDGRTIAQADKQDKLPCAPIKEFESESQCNKVQARLTSSASSMRSCKSNEIRKIDKLF